VAVIVHRAARNISDPRDGRPINGRVRGRRARHRFQAAAPLGIPNHAARVWICEWGSCSQTVTTDGIEQQFSIKTAGQSIKPVRMCTGRLCASVHSPACYSSIAGVEHP